MSTARYSGFDEVFHTVNIPSKMMYSVDWRGWLKTNNVEGWINLPGRRVLFKRLEDVTAFKLTFGV